jgi:multifunctional cyclase/dehydratase/O-methyltransferase
MLGLADMLKDGPRDWRVLAAATRTHAPSLARVLRLLASVGVFEEREGGRFALAPLGELLRDDVPGSLRALVLLLAGVGVQDAWKDLEYCVRTGDPAYRRTAPGAADVYTLAAGDPDAAALFDRAMATFAPQTARSHPRRRRRSRPRSTSPASARSWTSAVAPGGC